MRSSPDHGLMTPICRPKEEEEKKGKKKKQERRSSLATGAASPNNFIKARRHLLAGGGVLEEINIHEQIGAGICQHHNRCYQFVCERQLKYCKWIKAKVSRVATEHVSATSLRSEPMASKSCEKSHSFFFLFKEKYFIYFYFLQRKGRSIRQEQRDQPAVLFLTPACQSDQRVPSQCFL